MAEFQFKCPQCGQVVEADETCCGQTAECPFCGKGIVVPPSNPQLGIARNAGSEGTAERLLPPMQKPLMPGSTSKERAVIPERLTCPTQDQSVPSGKIKIHSPGLLRKILFVLSAVIVIAVVGGVASYGGYLYFGDIPRLERGIVHYEKKAYHRAFKLLLPLAKKGYATAQLYVGDSYANGNGVITDSEEAVKWYRAAADQELPAAQYRMYQCSFGGVGMERNIENAAKWCRKSANAGFEKAMFDMGMMYAEGLGVKQSAKSAFMWYRKGAERGYPPSLYQFGLFYKRGIGVEKDEDEASKWQDKAVSAWRERADAGDVESMIYLGKLYMDGDIVELDKEKAVQWYRKAAESGNAHGQSRLAFCYHKGEGVAVDNEEAARWMLKSAEQGVDRESQCTMGEFYLNGIGVTKDAKEAVKWFERSAERGLPKAKYSLAMCYLRGDGVEADSTKGEKLLEKAVEAGDKDAKNTLDMIRREREEKARKIVQEKKGKEDKIVDLSRIEDEIEGLKSRINNILKGKQGGDWSGFDSGKITMTDTSVSITEEQPLKRNSENLSEKDSMKKIDQFIITAQKDVERLQERLTDIDHVKKLYDEKELESRKETCAQCYGTGTVDCPRCKGGGEVVNKERRPCPTCHGEARIYDDITCSTCRGTNTLKSKCTTCNGKGGFGVQLRLSRERCSSCNGTGRMNITCPKCSGGKIRVERQCSTCKGLGEVMKGNKKGCPLCKGKCKGTCDCCGGIGFTYRPKDGTSAVEIAKGLYQRGMRLYAGKDGVLQDENRAFGCFVKASELGYASADAMLSYMYCYGQGCKKDVAKSFALAQKGVSSDDKEASGMARFTLGSLYLFGFVDTDGHSQQDNYKAYKYISEAIVHHGAVYLLGLMEYHGVGTMKNAEKAARCFAVLRDAKGDYLRGTATMCLGQLFYQGYGVEKDHDLAWKLLRTGAQMAFPELIQAAKLPITNYDVVRFNSCFGQKISFWTPYSWKMYNLYKDKGNLGVYGGVKIDLLEQALRTLFNPDRWDNSGVEYNFDDM